jgi:hypothetical protein
MKKSDKVVHNEKIGYYGYTLEYGTTLSSPPIQIENVSGWKNEKLIQLKRNFDTELKLVQDKYNEIVESWIVNERVYSAKCGFIPVMGNVYHLFINKKDEEFLSIISPDEWDMEWVGSYELSLDGKWKTVKQKE